MVDFQSRYRMYSLGYTPPHVRTAVPSLKELKHETNPRIHGRRANVHDCRTESMKGIVDKDDFGAYLLAHGLKQSFEDANVMHSKPKEEVPAKKRQLDKLLIKCGRRGKADGQFLYPRSLMTNLDGDIILADTGNNRIQILNQFGVHKITFGSKGSEDGEFNEPTGITELPNGYFAVADKKNKRIQLFDRETKYKSKFSTQNEPLAIACDRDSNIVVSTTNQSIEIYNEEGELNKCFKLGGKPNAATPVAVNEHREVVVLDILEKVIKTFSFSGKLVNSFQPESGRDGLAMFPSNICLTPIGEIVVTDSVNHVVNLYSDAGDFVEQLIGPTEDAGPVQAVSVGPEGHLITSESSVTGDHCVKIFRYRECACHIDMRGTNDTRTSSSLF